MSSQRDVRVDLSTPVQYLKGVGPKRAPLLARLKLRTARDLLFFFPRDYQRMAPARGVEELSDNVPCTFSGDVEEVEFQPTANGCMFGALVRQASGLVRAVWFNQPHMVERLRKGQRVVLNGPPKFVGGRWEFRHPKFEILQPDGAAPQGNILPIYSLTEGLNQGQMRRIVESVVHALSPNLVETLPEEVLHAHHLSPIHTALPQLHAPSDEKSLAEARSRFIYQELLVLQLALAMRKHRLTTQRRAAPLPATAKIDARIVRLFPFELTSGQRLVINEIAEDMALERPMNRLLQGDVGSGKTAVAAYAMLLAVAHRSQAALMAPTEVLARQHERTLGQLLRHADVRIGLFTGSLTAAARRQLLEQAAAGEIDLVVGTQAIVQSAVEFKRLGLVVIDEQHKFGVRQRAALKQAGLDPHYLVMTATPIPRTVTMTLFGDLAVSTLRDSPPGRQPVHTYLAQPEQRRKWWEFFCRKLREGRQGYVIVPLVDDSESIASTSVRQAFEELAHGELEAFRLDLIHGRQDAQEKEAVMESFRRGKTQVLVATSVVEVGVDVPNATLMTIENGERFGLAQLHQLRGRVCRGKTPGYACVFADSASEDSYRRLQAFAETTDGFKLAEIDFHLRGPGDLFGTRQHGLPPLRIADLQRDADVLEQARQDAQRMVAADADLQAPGYERLRQSVIVRYGKALDLVDVG